MNDGMYTCPKCQFTTVAGATYCLLCLHGKSTIIVTAPPAAPSSSATSSSAVVLTASAAPSQSSASANKTLTAIQSEITKSGLDLNPAMDPVDDEGDDNVWDRKGTDPTAVSSATDLDEFERMLTSGPPVTPASADPSVSSLPNTTKAVVPHAVAAATAVVPTLTATTAKPTATAAAGAPVTSHPARSTSVAVTSAATKAKVKGKPKAAALTVPSAAVDAAPHSNGVTTATTAAATVPLAVLRSPAKSTRSITRTAGTHV